MGMFRPSILRKCGKGVGLHEGNAGCPNCSDVVESQGGIIELLETRLAAEKQEKDRSTHESMSARKFERPCVGHEPWQKEGHVIYDMGDFKAIEMWISMFLKYETCTPINLCRHMQR